MGYKTLLIYNPTAGPWEMSRTLQRLAVYLSNQNWQVDLVQTEQSGDATRLAGEAAQAGYQLVLTAGGDGTINEVTNGLANTNTIMGIVPVGTGNILAHQLRMPILSPLTPLHVTEVGDALLSSRVQRVDVGVADQRRFLCWAGIGLDAEIAAQMEPRPRHTKRLGALPYAIAAVSVASAFRGVRTKITVGGRRYTSRALLVLVSNIQLYAAFFSIARHARMDDGLMDIFIFKGLGWTYALRHLVRVTSGRYLSDPEVVQILANHLVIETTPAVAVHLDGDPFRQTPTDIYLEPGRLRFLVPPQAPADLFSKPPEIVL